MIRVVVVDDHVLFRSGVRAELESSVHVVGEAADVESSLEVIQETNPDVVLLDVHMPGGGGAEVVRNVRARDENIRFLALSVSDAAEDVIDVIRAGARGYVTKTISVDDLVEAIERVHHGDAVFSPRLAGFVLDAFSDTKQDTANITFDPELDSLTPREREVLRHIARGYTYREISQQLYISPKTVETHVSSVLRKLQLSNRHELSVWAAKRRLD